MKKFGLLMVAVMVVSVLVSCGETKEETTTSSVALGTRWNQVNAKTPTAPDWVYGSSWEEGTWNGDNVVFILVEGSAMTMEKAEISADLEKIETLASAIKQLATTKLGAASSGMLNDDEDIDTYFEKTVAAVSENVDISGAMSTGSYWIYGELINDAEGTVEPQYRWYERYAISAAKIQAALEDAWNETEDEYPEELKEEVGSTLDSLMSASSAKSE